MHVVPRESKRIIVTVEHTDGSFDTKSFDGTDSLATIAEWVQRHGGDSSVRVVLTPDDGNWYQWRDQSQDITSPF